LGHSLQRLFSTFPNSWPGFGLLLLRTCLGIALIFLGIAGMVGKPQDFISLAPYLISAVGGVFLLAGLRR
jgi:putative oxidoreductase